MVPSNHTGGLVTAYNSSSSGSVTLTSVGILLLCTHPHIDIHIYAYFKRIKIFIFFLKKEEDIKVGRGCGWSDLVVVGGIGEGCDLKTLDSCMKLSWNNEKLKNHIIKPICFYPMSAQLAQHFQKM